MDDMNRMRYNAERERRLNIPDETDEEYIARLAAARPLKVSSGKRTRIEAGDSPSSTSQPVSKKLKAHGEDERNSDPVQPRRSSSSNPCVSDTPADHESSYPNGMSTKRKYQDAGLEDLRTNAKKARSMHDADTELPSTSSVGAYPPPSPSYDPKELYGSQASSSCDRPQLDSKNSGDMVCAGADRPSIGACDGQPSSGVAGLKSDELPLNKTLGKNANEAGNARTNNETSRSSVGQNPRDNILDEQQRKAPSPVVNRTAQKVKTAGLDPAVHTSLPSAKVSKPKAPLAETPKKAADSSNVTTPGNSTVLDSAFTAIDVDNAQAGPSKNHKTSRNTAAPKKGKAKKEKLPLMTPPEYVKWAQAQFDSGELKRHSKGVLAGKRIFFCNNDLKYASEGTRKKINYLLYHGATLLPEYDDEQVTHIVTDVELSVLLRACGVKRLEYIRADVPILKWSWAASPIHSTTGKLGYYHNHATFKERVLYDPGVEAQIMKNIARSAALKSKSLTKGKGKEKARDHEDHDSESEAEYSKISEFTEESIPKAALPDAKKPPTRQTSERPRLQFEARPKRSASSASHGGAVGPANAPAKEGNAGDPLAEFYERARAEREAEDVGEWDRWSDSDGHSEHHDPEAPKRTAEKGKQRASTTFKANLRGFQCDNKTPATSGPCPNQDVVDLLQELMGLHEAKPTADDNWRTFIYRKVIPAVRRHPTRIQSVKEARTIPFVGQKTAEKIMEIINTGKLTRIAYESTDDVAVIKLFTGIYGVGRLTAYRWYNNGCRTLADLKAKKGGVKLSLAQKIGLQYYDDINTRMPRQEAQDIYNLIKPVALALDDRLFIEIMGSFRRGKADCGDIDILITRPTDDGKTHAGILRRLLAELRKRGILTEDLSIPDGWDSLELVYRGLCCKEKGSPRRRIDFLTVPYESRGAALLYYTGDDIFNRSMRMKANRMGYSLNQRGLYHNVIRNPRNRQEKFDNGQILASETEREIFDILGVPWQEPHERVRS